jgi:hypothetical protein
VLLGSAGCGTALAASSQIGFEPVGSLAYIWHGDPARGCALEGLCGVSGSIQIVTGDSSSSQGGTRTPPVEISDDGSVARVDDASSGGAQRACDDVVPVDESFDVRNVGSGRLRAVLERDSFELPSAGRCAGPTAAELASVVLPARKLGRRGYDLSGSDSFGAGPFDVTVVSTLRALFVSESSGPVPPISPPVSPAPSPPKPRPALQEYAEVDYRVAGITGEVGASFSGLADPLCEPQGACGTAGQLSLALTANRQELDFYGSRIVKRRVASAKVLADLRAGRLDLSDSAAALTLGGELTGTLTGGGGVSCSDRVAQHPTGLSSSATRLVDHLKLDPSSPFGLFSATSADTLRTRCPGPGNTDIIHGGALATASVAADEIGAPRLTISLGACGDFTGSSYRGVRSGSIVLTLARVRVSGGTRRIKVFSGQFFSGQFFSGRFFSGRVIG